MKKNILLELLELYYTFVKIGTFTIGGGLAMMPMLRRELIDNRGWITEEELLDYYAVGQSTPGIIAVNVSTFVGYKRAGIIGGIIGTLGMVTPSFVIIMLLARLINSVSEHENAKKALLGINVAVAALLTHVVFSFAKKTIKTPVNLIFMLVSFFCVGVLKLPSYIIILAAIAIACVLVFVRARQLKKHPEKEGEEK
jgi:chromate transporter